MTTDTPRTDAEALKWGPYEGVPNVVIPAHFARDLERELTAMQEEKETFLAPLLAHGQLEAKLKAMQEERDGAKAALAESEARCAVLVETLQGLAEYWNGSSNERAMSDACQHTVDVCEEVLSSLHTRSKEE